MNVPDELFDTWLSASKAFYHGVEALDRGQHGIQLYMQYRSGVETGPVLGTVSLTFYKSTSRIHVQGSSYVLWLEEHWPRIHRQVDVIRDTRRHSNRITSQRTKMACLEGVSTTTASMSPVNCKTCDTYLEDGDNGGHWRCHLCESAYHGLCAEPADTNTLGHICSPCIVVTSESASSTSTDTTVQLLDHVSREHKLDKLNVDDISGNNLASDLTDEALHEKVVSTSPRSANIDPTVNSKRHSKTSEVKKCRPRIAQNKVTKKPALSAKHDNQYKGCGAMAAVVALQRTVRELESKYVDLLNEVHILRNRPNEECRQTAGTSTDITSSQTEPNDLPGTSTDTTSCQTEPQDLHDKSLSIADDDSEDEPDQHEHDKSLVETDTPLENRFIALAEDTTIDEPPVTNAHTDTPVHQDTSDDTDDVNNSLPPPHMADLEALPDNANEDIHRDSSTTPPHTSTSKDRVITKEDIPTVNSAPGSPLQSNQSDAKDAPTTLPDELDNKERATHVPPSHDARGKTPARTDVLIVTSSIGKALEARKMYRNKHVVIKNLTHGKNLQDAKLTIERTKTLADLVVFIVGSNDLAQQKTVSKCMVEVDHLISNTRKVMGGDVNIAFSQILTRTDRNIFNKKSKDSNKRLEYMCEKSTKK